MSENNKFKILEHTHEFIKWVVPKVNRFPREYKFTLGEEIIKGWYKILKSIIFARYQRNKRAILLEINIDLEIQRHFLRLAHDFKLLSAKSYGFAIEKVDNIGREIGGWLKSLK